MGGSHNRDMKDTFLNDDELIDEELLAEAIKRMENADLSVNRHIILAIWRHIILAINSMWSSCF